MPGTGPCATRSRGVPTASRRSNGTCSPACRCCAGAGISTRSPPSPVRCCSDRSSTSSWTWSSATSCSPLPRCTAVPGSGCSRPSATSPPNSSRRPAPRQRWPIEPRSTTPGGRSTWPGTARDPTPPSGWSTRSPIPTTCARRSISSRRPDAAKNTCNWSSTRWCCGSRPGTSTRASDGSARPSCGLLCRPPVRSPWPTWRGSSGRTTARRQPSWPGRRWTSPVGTATGRCWPSHCRHSAAASTTSTMRWRPTPRLAGSRTSSPAILLGTPVRYGPTAGQAVASGAAHNLAALWTHRSLPTAIEWQHRALSLAEIEGDPRITAVNSARLGLLHLVGGDPSAAAEPITRAAELLTGRVTARWEDTVTFARARLLEWQDAGSAAEAAYRDLTTSALAGGRLLHAVLGSCALADLLIRRGALPEADAALRHVDAVLASGADVRQRARLQVRARAVAQAARRRAGARALLDAVGPTFPDDELSPERIVWFVESALLEPRPDDAARHVAALAPTAPGPALGAPRFRPGAPDLSQQQTPRPGRRVAPPTRHARPATEPASESSTPSPPSFAERAAASLGEIGVHGVLLSSSGGRRPSVSVRSAAGAVPGDLVQLELGLALQLGMCVAGDRVDLPRLPARDRSPRPCPGRRSNRWCCPRRGWPGRRRRAGPSRR